MKLKTMAMTAAVLALAVQPGFAAESVGYNRVSVPAAADVRLSVPFNNNAAGSFIVNSKTGTGVAVTNSLTAGAYANSYYVRFTSGKGAGLWSTISNNGANDFTLVDEDILPFLSAGDMFNVYPHHTLISLFPASMVGVSHVNGTRILIYVNDVDAMAQNKSAAKVALFNSGNWQGSGVNNNTIVEPDTQLILRNNAASTLTVYTKGNVPDHVVSRPIAANGDLNIGTGYPLPLVLKNAGLNGQGRRVLLYDNNAPGQNKSAVKTPLFNAGSWVGSGVTGNELLNPSESFTLRLPSAEAGAKVTINKPY